MAIDFSEATRDKTRGARKYDARQRRYCEIGTVFVAAWVSTAPHCVKKEYLPVKGPLDFFPVGVNLGSIDLAGVLVRVR